MKEPRTISLLPWQVTLAEFTQKAHEVASECIDEIGANFNTGSHFCSCLSITTSSPSVPSSHLRV